MDAKHNFAIEDEVSTLSEQHIIARVCWYYFIGALTQQEIADKLGLTRFKVNKIVGQARTDGTVHIDIRLPLTRCVSLEERVKARFDLDNVTVVPTVKDFDQLQQIIGTAAGEMLDPLLLDGQGLSVGWGRTLSAAARRISPRNYSESWVVSLMGGLTRGSGTNTFEVSTRFATALGTDCFYITAPIYCPSPESRDLLLSHSGLADVMRRARDCSIALVTSGDLTNRSLLTATQTIAAVRDELIDAGAVGDILGTFIDEYGRPIRHPINSRVMALAPEELKAYPISILASGGLPKLRGIRGILNARYVRSLVTDESVAEALLQ